MRRNWNDEVEFVDVVIRQAHPRPGVPTYHSFEQKMHDAESYKREDNIAWTVLVDDLPGMTHQVYGGLADPTYIIDQEGRVAFYSMWTHAPTLHTSLEMLRAQGWRGVVGGGIDKTPHVAAAMTDGWNGLRRGLPQSLMRAGFMMQRSDEPKSERAPDNLFQPLENETRIRGDFDAQAR